MLSGSDESLFTIQGDSGGKKFKFDPDSDKS